MSGGDGQNRTDDPLRAKQMLSQLSYAPILMVGLERLELSTSRLSGVRSNHLSYRPIWTYFFQRAFGSLQVKNELDFSLKGGDPAAGSPTAALLRLHPNYRAYRRRLPPLRVGSPASGKTDFRGVTGGVYKARERIHPGMLIQNY